MGEKVARADISLELPLVNSLREALAPDALSPESPTHPASSPGHNGQSGQEPSPDIKTLDEALTAKTYFDQIIENAPEAISIVDPERRILRINGEFTRLFGFKPAEALGKQLDQLIVPPDRYTVTAWSSEKMAHSSKCCFPRRGLCSMANSWAPMPPIATLPSKSAPSN